MSDSTPVAPETPSSPQLSSSSSDDDEEMDERLLSSIKYTVEPGSVPVFEPTEAQFADFHSFIQEIEYIGSEYGLVKVIPPASYVASADEYQSQLSSLVIHAPVEQNVTGAAGVYRNIAAKKPDMTIRHFAKLSAEVERQRSRRERAFAAANNYSELERAFWQNIASSRPVYGADTDGSLFDDNALWNMTKLNTVLSCVDGIGGVTKPMLYVGLWKALFTWHIEDMNLYSINYIHRGQPKQWYSIPPAQADRFERCLSDYFPLLQRACNQFIRHKEILLSPTHLRDKYNINVNRIVHHQGEFMITWPRSYHQGFNYGFNIAESVNFGTVDWIPQGRLADWCECLPGSSVRINMDWVEAVIYAVNNAWLQHPLFDDTPLSMDLISRIPELKVVYDTADHAFHKAQQQNELFSQQVQSGGQRSMTVTTSTATMKPSKPTGVIDLTTNSPIVAVPVPSTPSITLSPASSIVSVVSSDDKNTSASASQSPTAASPKDSLTAALTTDEGTDSEISLTCAAEAMRIASASPAIVIVVAAQVADQQIATVKHVSQAQRPMDVEIIDSDAADEEAGDVYYSEENYVDSVLLNCFYPECEAGPFKSLAAVLKHTKRIHKTKKARTKKKRRSINAECDDDNDDDEDAVSDSQQAASDREGPFPTLKQLFDEASSHTDTVDNPTPSLSQLSRKMRSKRQRRDTTTAEMPNDRSQPNDDAAESTSRSSRQLSFEPDVNAQTESAEVIAQPKSSAPVASVQQSSPANTPTIMTTTTTVAMSFDVEAITGHRIAVNSANTNSLNAESYEFCVKWIGYTDTTWEPFSHVHHVLPQLYPQFFHQTKTISTYITLE